jgi:hypothetical protein
MRITSSLVVALVLICSSAESLPVVEGAPWKVAVVPMSATLFTPDDSLMLLRKVREELAATNLYVVMPEEEMLRLLNEARFQDIRQCTYSHCLADLGRVVGVERVVQTIFMKRGKLYTFRLRVVNAMDAEILFDETVEHSGEYESFLNTAVPDLVKKSTAGRLQSSSSYKWYYIGAAVLGFGAAVYFLNKALGHSNQPVDNPPPPNQD